MCEIDIGILIEINERSRKFNETMSTYKAELIKNEEEHEGNKRTTLGNIRTKQIKK